MNDSLTPNAMVACVCPNCRKVLKVRLEFANRRALCRGCRTPFVVPSREELVDFAASAVITHDVDDEFRDRERRYQSPPRSLVAPEREDPFASLDAS